MSILITGIDMPTKGNPITVSIYPDGTAEWEAQHKTGTAIPLPPHGRLGDLDALTESLRSILNDPNCPLFVSATVDQIVDCAPTIIPAEEGE